MKPIKNKATEGNHNQKLGAWGELCAENFLLAKGYQLLGKNVRTEYGELDLIMRDNGEIVFVEVKTRSNRKYGLPEEALTYQKKRHLINAAEAFLQEHPEFGETWRIDVVAVEGRPGAQYPIISWFSNAVTE